MFNQRHSSIFCAFNVDHIEIIHILAIYQSYINISLRHKLCNNLWDIPIISNQSFSDIFEVLFILRNRCHNSKNCIALCFLEFYFFITHFLSCLCGIIRNIINVGIQLLLIWLLLRLWLLKDLTFRDL